MTHQLSGQVGAQNLSAVLTWELHWGVGNDLKLFFYYCCRTAELPLSIAKHEKKQSEMLIREIWQHWRITTLLSIL